MEFVGRRVRKEFEGYGMRIGTVGSYKADSGFFEIVYEDGNSEELELSSIISLVCDTDKDVDGNDEPSAKKRRYLEDGSSDSGNSGSLNLNVSSSAVIDSNIIESKVLDLNKGVENDDNEIDCFITDGEGVNGRGEFIDLNLDVTEAEHLDERLEINRKNHSFDLNFGFVDENKVSLRGNGDGDGERQCMGSSYEGAEKVGEHVEMKEKEANVSNISNGVLEGAEKVGEHVEMEEKEANVSNISNGVLEGVQSEEKTMSDEMNDANLIQVELKDCFIDNVDSAGLDPGSSISGSALEGRLDPGSTSVSGSALEGRLDPGSTSVSGSVPKERLVPDSPSVSATAPKVRRGRRRRVVVDNASNADTDSTSVSGSAPKGRLDSDSTNVSDSAPPNGNRGRKRKVIMDSASNADMGTVLRRSTRRAKVASVSVQDDGVSVAALSESENSLLASPVATAVSEPEMMEVVDDEGNANMGTILRRSTRRAKVASISVQDNGVSVAVLSESINSLLASPVATAVSEPEMMEIVDDEVNADMGTVLRRSTRRAKVAAISDQDNGVNVAVLSESENSLLASPLAMAIFEPEMMEVVDDEGLEEDSTMLPPKAELPSSSDNLDFAGMPALDVFSVYSFLRSFSTLLFLSPFELEDFVAAVKSAEPTVLFDSIHISLLQTLRKHLESLSDDSSQSASSCLRSLDWGLLDLTTWPMFLAEYMLMHSCSLGCDFDLCRMRLLESDYYTQPPYVKIEILRCLCDDSIDVEGIKSELNRRTLATELGLECTRKRNAMDVASSSCVTEEDNDENQDHNSDDCCLCKMEGTLICCDGCPAAFHSRCVGVSSSLLPEGDWFCPECVIDKDKPWMKMGKSLRGANPLGIDAYGRLYYSSCGYLLVLEDYYGETLVKYYHKNDLPAVIDALKLSETSYHAIIAEISKQWLESSQFKTHTESNTRRQSSGRSKSCLKTRTLDVGRSKSCLKTRALEVGIAEDISAALDHTKSEVTDSIDMKSEIANCTVNNGNLFASSEGSTEVSQILNGRNSSAKPGFECEIPGDAVNVVGCSLTRNHAERTSINSAKQGGLSTRTVASTITEGKYMTYVNCYSFARIAAAVAEDFSRKSTNKNAGAVKSVEEIISDQLKALLTQCTHFSFPSVPCSKADFWREECGWCFSCKSPEYEKQCLIAMINACLPIETFTSDLYGVQSRIHNKGHFMDLLCLVLSIEARLHGLLLGPWLNPHYSQLWRKSLHRTSDIASLKFLLLKLESNLSPLAFSEAWVKHIDSDGTMGSGVFVKINSSRISRKKARLSNLETTTITNSAKELSSYWWRGGRLSRMLFNWRVLPCSVASKAARQAGCKKLHGILYPDSSEFPTRSKCVAWRADVESSKSVEQLAFQADSQKEIGLLLIKTYLSNCQVRQLYANIKWEDIENTHLSSKLDKEPKKPIRSFKKATIRQKCTEGTIVKYLLDFGKRRFIPDIAVKKGCKVEDGTSERKKYWLEEYHVPLYLLKAFEEKRIARKSNKSSPGKLCDFKSALKHTFKKKGFAYLFSRAEMSEYYQCGHCIKDVLIREAVSCQHCKGYFHKRHVKKSAGTTFAKCTYTCHKCSGRKIVKLEPKKENCVSEKGKGAKGMGLRSKSKKKTGKSKEVVQSKRKNKEDTVVVTLRRSPRCFPLQKKKVRAQKGKQRKSSKAARKKQTKNRCQRKRTKFVRTYWLNGLRLTKKPNDERVKLFKAQNKVVVCGESTSLLDKPRCSLCNEQKFCSWLNYVACEICGDWFHEDAFDPRGKNIYRLVGFKCHTCLKKNPPLCPHLDASRSKEPKVMGFDNDDAAGNGFVVEESTDPAIPMETIKIDLHLTFESKALPSAADTVRCTNKEIFHDSSDAL